MILDEHETAKKAALTAIKRIMSSPREIFLALIYDDIDEIHDIEVLLSLCHNLVVLDHELNVLRFTHLSVREYLEKYHHTDADAHSFVGKTCLNVLQPYNWTLKRKTKGLEQSTLAEYALLYWPFHLQRSDPGAKGDLQAQLQEYLGHHHDKMSPFLKWYAKIAEHVHGYPHIQRNTLMIYPFLKLINGDPPSPLVFAAVFGFRSYLSRALRQSPELVDVTNKHKQTLIMLGASCGHDSIVHLLLESGADACRSINDDSCIYANALQAAAIGGHIQTVNILLDSGIPIDSIGGRYGNALQAAAFYGHEALVELLYKKGASTHVGCYWGNAIHTAAHSGNDSLVEYLLDIGEDVNCISGKLGSPLACAAEKGHTKIAQLLIDAGADVNMQAGIYGSPLHVAALWGHEDLAELLLRNGADVNGWDASARTPLHEAITKGHSTSMIDRLLSHGVDPQ
jgi:ankyrin repeat protein